MNAYRITLAVGYENIADWWYGSKNIFSHHGYHSLAGGDILLMADPNERYNEFLESAKWCAGYCGAQVNSPQVGDTEPTQIHETIEAGDQLLWVS